MIVGKLGGGHMFLCQCVFFKSFCIVRTSLRLSDDIHDDKQISVLVTWHGCQMLCNA